MNFIDAQKQLENKYYYFSQFLESLSSLLLNNRDEVNNFIKVVIEKFNKYVTESANNIDLIKPILNSFEEFILEFSDFPNRTPRSITESLPGI